MTEIALEEVYGADGRYLGKIAVDSADLAVLDSGAVSFLAEMYGEDRMGYRKYHDRVIAQTLYIFRTVNEK